MERDAANGPRPAGGRRARLADVAAESGVSPATVSLVLRGVAGPSEATRRRVLDVAAALGYRPDRTASSLARRRSGLLGVLLDVRNPFHAELVEEVDVAAQQVGYAVVLSTVTRARDESRAVETLLDFRCEALVLLGTEASTERLAELNASVPTIVVGRRLRPLVADVVRTADAAGVGRSVDHLVELGHRDVVYVDGGAGTIAADRRRGYRVAMRRRGLDDRGRVLPGGHTEVSGVRAAGTLLAAGDLPTAVMAFSDRVAIGVVDTLARAGVRVPEQVSVVGYDDSPQSQWAHVALTTVSQEAGLQSGHVVRLAVDRLEGRPGPQEVVLEPRLVVRSTTGPPPAQRCP